MTIRPSLALCLSAALTSACSWPPKEHADRARAAAEQFDREMNAEAAAWKAKADADFRKRIADPGSLTVEASDALIADLKSLDPLTRSQAAAGLANAKGARGVDPLIWALRAERDEATFVVLIRALDHINDVRAVDAMVEALGAPGMSDKARERALHSINRFRSTWRLIPEIRRFHDSLTDEAVRARVASLLKAYGLNSMDLLKASGR